MAAAWDADRSAQFLRALGDELREARKRRGWLQRDLCERLTVEISPQALGSYERGTRAITVVRLFELTEALEVSLPDLLNRTLNRIEDLRSGASVDLVTLAKDNRPELAALRRWARARLTHTKARESTLVKFDRPGIEWLAELCGVAPAELITLIHQASTIDNQDRPCRTAADPSADQRACGGTEATAAIHCGW